MRNRFRAVAVLVLAAGLAAPAVGSAAGVPPNSATRDQYVKAQTLFEKSKKLFEKGKVAESLDGFRKSYDIVASPISHLFIARCLVSAGQEREAFNEMSIVMTEAAAAAVKDPKYGETREAAEQERSELAPKLALVVPRVGKSGDDATLTVAGVAIARERWSEPYAVAPGPVEVVLSAGGKSDRRSVTVATGERKEVGVAIGEPPPVVSSSPSGPSEDELARERRRASMRTAAYVAGGVGVAGLATFAIAGSIARSKYDSLKDECGGGPCDASRKDDVASGRRTATIANVGLIVGAVGVAAGTTLFVLSGSSKKEPSAVSTEVAAAPGWVEVRGRF